MGLLMNHLGVDGKGRVVFDAGDVEEEEEDDVEEEEDEEDLDLDKLQGEWYNANWRGGMRSNRRDFPTDRPLHNARIYTRRRRPRTA